MIDIKFLRENPEIVKENIRKKFQEHKLPLVDEVIELDKKSRELTVICDELRMRRNSISKEIGALMANGKKEEAESKKAEVQEINNKLEENEKLEAEYAESIKERMMKIPNIIHESVPIGKDDSQNVEIEKFGEPVVPSYEIPYHTDIMESLNGIDLDSARRVAGNGFYYSASARRTSRRPASPARRRACSQPRRGAASTRAAPRPRRAAPFPPAARRGPPACGCGARARAASR